MVSVAVHTDVSPAEPECHEFVVEQTGIPEDKQGGPELSSASTEHFSANQLNSKFNTIRLEPTWTREYLHDQQVADSSLKVIVQFKDANVVRPRWKMWLPMTVQSRQFGPSGTSW